MEQPFDDYKNKGVEYDSGLRIDYPSAKTTKREFKIIEDQ